MQGSLSILCFLVSYQGKAAKSFTFLGDRLCKLNNEKERRSGVLFDDYQLEENSVEFCFTDSTFLVTKKRKAKKEGENLH